MESVANMWLWGGFLLFVFLMLALDLGVFHRKTHTITAKEALIWSGVWISLALLFNLGVYFWFGKETATNFLTGYLIEKSLSVDNIFVFLLIFSAFKVPRQYEHRVLFWGVLGALMMRAVLIFAGSALLTRFHWIIYIFGAFLLFTGIKLMVDSDDEHVDPQQAWFMRAFRRLIRSTPTYEGGSFFVKKDGLLYATPLLAVLVSIEISDLIFAVDSIPAIFAVTLDPFIVFTSNIFAILGLRSLYFLLAGVADKFCYLKYGLALVLSFVGIKMLVVGFVKIPSGLSLGIIAVFLVGSVIASLVWPKKEQESIPEGIE